jgi:peptidoglycan DL-endopeptidase CwlO
MFAIVTDVERPPNHSTPRSTRSARLLRWVGIPTLTVVTVWSSTVVVATRPSAGDAISDAQAKAAQIEAQLASAQAEMSTLSQQYDAAAYHLKTIDGDIAATRATITADRDRVSKDRTRLSNAAVSTYVTDGSAASQNPIFSNNTTLGAANEYSKIAEGDIDLAVADLHTAENSLSAQESHLQNQQSQAQAAVNEEQAAINQNAAAIASQKAALAQETGEIATLVQQQQQAEAAQAAQEAQQQLADAAVSASSVLNVAAAPPTAAGGAGAVQAAESQIGVPYRWGAESPKGSADPGFDCSGLTAWSWGQVGVSLPHYSGAQMADSAPVPLSDLEPGDLLFYGPGGDEHVAMYIGGNQMIEAPYTGASVWITSARFGGGFAGAGRP